MAGIYSKGKNGVTEDVVIPKLNSDEDKVRLGKERYGASESPGYGEPRRLIPNPYATENEGENGYHFEPQGQFSFDHWGGKSDAQADTSNPTPVKTHPIDKHEVQKGFDESKDITLHDQATTTRKNK